MQQPKQRGGKRPGAGRKKTGKAKFVSVPVSPDVFNLLSATKKLKKSKSWNTFFVELITTSGNI